MENLIAAFDDSFKTSSKKIIQYGGTGKIETVRCKDFTEALREHFLGVNRWGVSPEVKGQEDKILFGGIDIDCKDKSIEEKYQMALNIQSELFIDYRLYALIEQSKSKGFHLFVFLLLLKIGIMFKIY